MKINAEELKFKLAARLLEEQWIWRERSLRDRVTTLKEAQGPWATVQSNAETIAQCRRELQEAFGFVLTHEQVDEIAKENK